MKQQNVTQIPMTHRAQHVYALIALVHPRDAAHTRLVARAVAEILGYCVSTSAFVAAENYIAANFTKP